jgi:AcrR family transcriptional regulator
MLRKNAKTRLSAGERRQRLIDASIELFADYGYEATSVDDIAKRAGITKPVVYDHFSSKEAIFIAALELIRNGLLARGAKVIANETEPSSRLLAGIHVFFDFIEETPKSARLLIMGSKGAPSIIEACKRVQAHATSGIARLMKPSRPGWRSSKKNERTLLLTAEFVKKGMHGLGEWWMDHPDVPRKEVEDVLAAVLRNGTASAGGWHLPFTK